MSEFAPWEEPAIVSANDAPSTEPEQPVDLPSLLPVQKYVPLSLLFSATSYFGYTYWLKDKTNGTSYKNMMLAQQVAWIPVFFATVITLVHRNVYNYMVFRTVVNSTWIGALYLNWLGLAYAQFLRGIGNTISFTNTDNLIGFAANLIFNIFALLATARSAIDLYKFEGEFHDAACIDKDSKDCKFAERVGASIAKMEK